VKIFDYAGVGGVYGITGGWRGDGQAVGASGADFDRRLQETDKEIKALAKNSGGLNNPPGKPLEQMFSVQLWDKFAALVREFIKSGDAKFKENNQTIAEAEAPA
jgi:hypothetical protein